MTSDNPNGDRTPSTIRVNKIYNMSTFQTPFKSNNSSDHKSLILDFLSSGKIDKKLNYNSYKCKRSDCLECKQLDEIILNVAMSPSNNFLIHSPSSLEHYLESFSRERINVMKLVKRKDENKKDIEKISYGKENSNPNSDSKTNKSAESTKSLHMVDNLDKLPQKLFSDNKFAKKNLMNIFINENDDKFLNKKIDRENSEIDKEYYFGMNFFNERKNSLKDVILNSPERKNSDINLNFNSTTKFTSTEKKKMIFLCSDQKTNSLTSSCQKITSYSATVYSTDKKNGKRWRKTSFQLQKLKEYYDENNMKDWTKEMIVDISQKIGLPENKVYKWLWDKKNKEMSEKKIFFIQNEINKD